MFSLAALLVQWLMPADFSVRHTGSSFPAELVPLKMLNARAANPFERYGIDRDGYCYSCNIAEIRWSDTAVWLRNVCDSGQQQRLSLLSVQHIGAQVVWRCREGVLVLEKMNEAPVFRLTQPVPPLLPGNLQLRDLFTDKARLHKFSVHDCGDFDG